MKKKFLYVLVFILFLLFFLYFTFPFEKFIGNALCKRGVEYEEVDFKRIPPVVVINGLKYPSLPFVVDRVEIHPSLLSLLKPLKKFYIVATWCGGSSIFDTTYPLQKLAFKVDGVNLPCLFKDKFKNVKGKLYGKGTLIFSRKGKLLTGGKGNFYTNDLRVSDLKFGIFTLPDVKVGKAELSYVVKGKNYVELKGKAEGKVNVKAEGFMRVNLKDFGRTYLSLNVKVVLKEGAFKNRPFSFRIAGYLSNLSVR